jgi:hypothetical protein
MTESSLAVVCIDRMSDVYATSEVTWPTWICLERKMLSFARELGSHFLVQNSGSFARLDFQRGRNFSNGLQVASRTIW